MGTSSWPLPRCKHGSPKNSLRSQPPTIPTTARVSPCTPFSQSFPKFLTIFRFVLISRTKERALLMFVLRDHIGTTPLSNLSETLKKDLANIWSSLSKPPGLENCAIEDYFDFQFTALPHKILMPEKFDEGVVSLRKRYSHLSALLPHSL
jgi:Root hair defective 3 GTP-binding protein (RHD3)